jgi:protease-4
MKKSPLLTVVFLAGVFGVLVFLAFAMAASFFSEKTSVTSSGSANEILHLKLEGIIMDGKKVLRPLRDFRKDKSVKAIVLEVNSPGGVVGPSQELFAEIKKTREDFKIPVVVISQSLNASGAYYTSVSADKIIVAPGTMIGSIGVIMEFANLEKLYAWAMISRFSLNTGKYKDSGAEYRTMRDDEKEIFQEMLNEVWGQFKTAVSEGRNLSMDKVEAIADGRIMTGAKAVELGLADSTGTLEDAFAEAAKLAQIKDYEIIQPKKDRPSIRDLIYGDDDEATASVVNQKIQNISNYLRAELLGRPLLLMPGVL